MADTAKLYVVEGDKPVTGKVVLEVVPTVVLGPGLVWETVYLVMLQFAGIVTGVVQVRVVPVAVVEEAVKPVGALVAAEQVFPPPPPP